MDNENCIKYQFKNSPKQHHFRLDYNSGWLYLTKNLTKSFKLNDEIKLEINAIDCNQQISSNSANIYLKIVKNQTNESIKDDNELELIEENRLKFDQKFYKFNLNLNSLKIGEIFGRLKFSGIGKFQIDTDLIQIEPNLGLISMHSLDKLKNINKILATITYKNHIFNDTAKISITVIDKLQNNLVNNFKLC